ncbi:Hypothetical predicted protein [Pelobates cultripes]|uniref:Uncharacterized protein n=1 Tax=Pelobates cultripes TaxID=61616 RepID=A0AAD1S9F5_PELCU|nr:Hypothetical predicted protein [Pelobates cultripes]
MNPAIRLDVNALRTDITAHGSRLQNLEAATHTMSEQAKTSTLVVTRQGNMLLALRRQTEDLDNRGRWSNIRIRGLPEPPAKGDVEATLTDLFLDILGPDMPDTLTFDRVHRANRPCMADNTPRDVIYCLHQYRHNAHVEGPQGHAAYHSTTLRSGHPVQMGISFCPTSKKPE